MNNKYNYINTFNGVIKPFTLEEGFVFGSTSFNYDLKQMPKYFGIIVSYWHEFTLNEPQEETLRSQSNFSVVRAEEINGKLLYPLFKQSVLGLSQYLNGLLKQSATPVVEVPCPLLEEIQSELDTLAADLNSFYQT